MSVADELRKLADLKNEGLLTEEEFQAQKTVILAGKPSIEQKEVVADESAVKPASTDEGLGVAGKVVGWALVIGAVIFGLIAFSGERQDAYSGTVSSIRADDLVFVKSAGYGCELASDFEMAVTHRQNQEITAWAMMVNKPYCFSSDALPVGYAWTVLSVKGKVAMITPEYTAANYEKFPEQRQMLGKSYWIFTDWIRKR